MFAEAERLVEVGLHEIRPDAEERDKGRIEAEAGEYDPVGECGHCADESVG